MEDSRFDRVCTILDKYKHAPSRLIPILREIQGEYGYLQEELMVFVSTALGVSPATVYGVATFYSHFTLEPKGRHIIKVCDGTACHVKRSEDIRDAIIKNLGLDGERMTTPDMMFTLETVACLGACSLAPAVVVDGKVHGLMTPAKVIELINKVREEEAAKNDGRS
jgi:NADH-quinone oxidoreductase subunit E